MTNRNLRNEYFKIIGEAIQEYGFSPLNGWIEALLSTENKGLTQREISDELSEILNDERFATSLTSVNRALKIMEANQIIIKEGSRKKGYKYYLNVLSGIPIGFFQKVLAVNTKNLMELQILKKKIVKSDDKSLLDGIEIEINFSQTAIKHLQKLLDELK